LAQNGQRPLLSVSVEQQVLWTIVRVTGELDYATQGKLGDCLFRLMGRTGEPRICVDVGKLDFCDSSGMACLVVATKVAKAQGGSLVLLRPAAHKLTMDGLAERAALGKGTVFRRFGTRAGIFQALLDDDERHLQEQVLSGSPPLGPGAPPLDRLIAYGRARIDFLIGHRQIARAALDGRERIPAGSQTPISWAHIRFLLGEMRLGTADLDVLATQLTAALDGPLLLYLSSAILTQTAPQVSERLGRGWEDLVQRVAGGQ
jgi:anti-anti-sigma factor